MRKKQLYWYQGRSVVLRAGGGRFAIFQSTDQFVAHDHEVGDVSRWTTLPMAKAWCESRFGGEIVHHADHALEVPTRVVVGNERLGRG